MKIKVPKIIKQLHLTEYAPEMDVTIDVWVNPPRAVMLEFSRLRALSEAFPQRLSALSQEEIDERRKIGDGMNDVGRQIAEWYATIWSQGQDASRHWSTDEVITLMEGMTDTDPMLFVWLMVQTHRLIAAHRTDIKKA